MNGFTRGKTPTTSFYDRFLPPGAGFAGATTVVADGDNLLLTSGFANAVQVFDPSTGGVSLDIRTLAGVTNAVRHDGDIVATECLFYQPRAAAASEGGVLADYRYRVPHPYCSVLYKSSGADPARMDVIALFVQPIEPERWSAWCAVLPTADRRDGSATTRTR